MTTTSLTFRLPPRVLKIDAAALTQLLAHQQIADDATESGGCLLGRVLRDGTAIVDEVTEPIPTDVRTRFTFHRSVEHQALLDAAYAKSEGSCGWLGEWHTHAEPDPMPSPTDLEDWRKRVVADIYDGPGVFFVIVGQRSTRAWFCDRAGFVTALA